MPKSLSERLVLFFRWCRVYLTVPDAGKQMNMFLSIADDFNMPKFYARVWFISFAPLGNGFASKVVKWLRTGVNNYDGSFVYWGGTNRSRRSLFFGGYLPPTPAGCRFHSHSVLRFIPVDVASDGFAVEVEPLVWLLRGFDITSGFEGEIALPVLKKVFARSDISASVFEFAVREAEANFVLDAYGVDSDVLDAVEG